MLWGTHAGIPVCGALIAENLSLRHGRGYVFLPWTMVAAGVFGILPDIFNPHITLEERHLSWSHSVWFLLALAPMSAITVSFFPAGDLPRWRTAVLCWLAAFLHVAMDAISGGVAWLYPWRPDVIGEYYIPPAQWLYWDAGFILLTYVLVRLRPLSLAKGMQRGEEDSDPS